MASEYKTMNVEETKPEVEVEDKPAEEKPAEDKPAEEKTEEKKDDGPSVVDLAFAMDCTGSMGSYIDQARQNIRTIVEEIVAAEKADVRLALVEYRDHPPQDSSFVTRVHDFTPSVKKMKGWLDKCSASGGGDGPEAVADALHQVLKLSWREEAAKICVFISDAPPHGLSSSSGDGFPNGCPDGLDPMQTANEIGEKGIVMYMVGCEPSITPYRDWFMAIAHITNGQYVPLASSTFLSKVIIGGAQEEVALQRLLEEVNLEVQQEAQAQGGGHLIDEGALADRVHSKLKSRGVMSKQLQMNSVALEGASSFGMKMAGYKNMADVKRDMDINTGSAGGSSSRMSRSSRAAAPAARKKSKKNSGGFSLMGMLGWGSSAKSAEESKSSVDDDEDSDVDCDDLSDISERYPAGYTVAPEKQEWSVKEGEIQQEQASRLVSRAMKMNSYK